MLITTLALVRSLLQQVRERPRLRRRFCGSNVVNVNLSRILGGRVSWLKLTISRNSCALKSVTKQVQSSKGPGGEATVGIHLRLL